MSSHRSPDEAVITFVGGPIQHALLGGGFDFQIQTMLESILDAFVAEGFAAFSAHRDEYYGEGSPLTPAEANRRDFRWVRSCHLFVTVPAELEGQVSWSDGTHIEMGWAGCPSRPVLIVGAQSPNSASSHLVHGLRQLARLGVVDQASLSRSPAIAVEEARKLPTLAPETRVHHAFFGPAG